MNVMGPLEQFSTIYNGHYLIFLLYTLGRIMAATELAEQYVIVRRKKKKSRDCFKSTMKRTYVIYIFKHCKAQK